MDTIGQLLTFCAAHPRVVVAGAVYFVFCNLVSSLPEPKPEERWYGAGYKFLHLLAGNAARIVPALRILRGGDDSK